MNIQFKFLVTHFCLFLWVLAPSFASTPSANLPTNPPFLTIKNNGETPPCNEPAPTNYHITEILTDRIIVAWDPPQSQPFQYNIKAWETSTGNLVYNQNIPGDMITWRVPNLQPNTEYRIRNTPVCGDGTLGSIHVEVIGTTLIIDLVVNSFSPPDPASFCTIGGNGQTCAANPLSGNVVKFKIQPKNSENEGRLFGVYQVGGCLAKTIMERPEDDTSQYQFYCNSQNNPNCSGIQVAVKKNGILIAIFSVGQTTSTGDQYVIWLGDNPYLHEIVCLTPPNGVPLGNQYNGCSTGHKRPGARNNDFWQAISTTPTLSAAPNPFTNHQDIQIPFAKINETIELNLYDLQGHRVMTLRSPGDQQTISLNTEKLSPGMYFLRAESGGIVQTVRVVKTQ